MAVAYKCDRCGRFYEVDIITKENVDKVEVYTRGEYHCDDNHIKVDLCGECQNKLIDFLNHYKGEGDK